MSAISHFGCSNPPEIDLGVYPVTEIVKVMIDGVLIPGPYDPVTASGEWELRDYQKLVRIRPTASATPTERWGWPTCQINDLPDSQEGTFSVTYRYGSPPPAAGRLAVGALAEVLTMPLLQEAIQYPQRVTTIARQGVTTQVASVIDVLKQGSLGIYEVDAFILAENPTRASRQALVWSPELGRPRRQAWPSV